MNKLYCISYSDFGSLLTDEIFDIRVRKLEGCDYGVYEDVLTASDLVILRRFIANTPSVFDDEPDSSDSLPPEIRRIVLTYKGIELKVIPSLDFQRLFGKEQKNEKAMVLTDDTAALPCYDEQTLSEDVLLLASNGADLNDPSIGEDHE